MKEDKEDSKIAWKRIADEINQSVHSGFIIRNGKHCRERWNNHLNPRLSSKYLV